VVRQALCGCEWLQIARPPHGIWQKLRQVDVVMVLHSSLGIHVTQPVDERKHKVIVRRAGREAGADSNRQCARSPVAGGLEPRDTGTTGWERCATAFRVGNIFRGTSSLGSAPQPSATQGYILQPTSGLKACSHAALDCDWTVFGRRKCRSTLARVDSPKAGLETRTKSETKTER
jgi:hypothetical protein